MNAPAESAANDFDLGTADPAEHVANDSPEPTAAAATPTPPPAATPPPAPVAVAPPAVPAPPVLAAAVDASPGGPPWKRDPIGFVLRGAKLDGRLRDAAQKCVATEDRLASYRNGPDLPARRSRLLDEIGSGTASRERIADLLANPAVLQLTAEARRALEIGACAAVAREVDARLGPLVAEVRRTWDVESRKLRKDAEAREAELRKRAAKELGVVPSGFQPLTDAITAAENRLQAFEREWHRQTITGRPGVAPCARTLVGMLLN